MGEISLKREGERQVGALVSTSSLQVNSALISHHDDDGFLGIFWLSETFWSSMAFMIPFSSPEISKVQNFFKKKLDSKIAATESFSAGCELMFPVLRYPLNTHTHTQKERTKPIKASDSMFRFPSLIHPR